MHVEGEPVSPGDQHDNADGLRKRSEVAAAVWQVLLQLPELQELKLCGMPLAHADSCWAGARLSLRFIQDITYQAEEAAAAAAHPNAGVAAAQLPNLQLLRCGNARHFSPVGAHWSQYASKAAFLPPSHPASAPQLLQVCYLHAVVTPLGQLFTALGLMTALQELHLAQLYDSPTRFLNMATLQPQQCTALTVSPNLSRLEVLADTSCRMALPRSSAHVCTWQGDAAPAGDPAAACLRDPRRTE